MEPQGLLLLDHLRESWNDRSYAPGVRGAVAISLRGGDYVVTLGDDLSQGHLRHDAGR